MAKKSKRVSRGFSAKGHPEKAPAAPQPQTSSWRLFLINLSLLKLYGAPVAVIIVVPALLIQLGTVMAGDITALTADPVTIAGMVIRFVAAVWSLLGAAAIYYYTLRVLGGNPPGILEAYRLSLRYLWRLIVLGIVLGLVISVGFVLLVVPGFIWLRRYLLAPYFLVDSDLDIRDALVASSKATKPVRKHVWSLYLILAVLLVVSYACTRYIPTYGAGLTAIISGLYVFLPALRYQEISSEVRAGALAFEAAKSAGRG